MKLWQRSKVRDPLRLAATSRVVPRMHFNVCMRL